MFTNFINQMKKADWKLFGCFLLSIIVCIPVMLLNDFPERDVAFRYAPMADAFSRGDWFYAFHPRVQMLHPLFSGLFSCLFSVNGYIGTQISGIFFHSIGIFPLFYILKETFGKKIAYWGIFAYVFSSRLLFIAASGLRESHKQFGILLLVLGIIFIYKQRTCLKGYIIAGTACGISVCTRNDIILYTVILFCFGTILDACKNIFPWRSIIAAVFALLFALPEFYVNYRITGFALPGTRFLELFYQAFHCHPTIANVLNVISAAFVIAFLIIFPAAGWFLRRKAGKWIFYSFLLAGLILFSIDFIRDVADCRINEPDKTLKNLFYGLLPIHFFIMLPGLGYRLFRKKFTGPEWILLCAYLLQGILVILQILGADNILYVSSRYLLPAAPLYFGWMGITVLIVWRILKMIPVNKSLRNGIVCILFLAFVFGSYADSLYKVMHLYGKGKDASSRRLSLKIAEVIRNDFNGERFWIPALDLNFYKTNCNPKIHVSQEEKYSPAIYWTGGCLCSMKEAEYVLLDTEKKLSEKQFIRLGTPIREGKKEVQIWKRKKI